MDVRVFQILFVMLAGVAMVAYGATCCPDCQNTGYTSNYPIYTSIPMADMPFGGVVTSVKAETLDGSPFRLWIDDDDGNDVELTTGDETTCFSGGPYTRSGSGYWLTFQCQNWNAPCTYRVDTDYVVNGAPQDEPQGIIVPSQPPTQSPSGTPTTPPTTPPPVAVSQIAIRIYSDDQCQNLQTSFNMPNDPTLCQSLGSGVYIMGSCINGQIEAQVYSTSGCSGASSTADLVRENTCGTNVFSGSGLSASYTCPGSLPPAAQPVSDAATLTGCFLLVIVVVLYLF